MMFVYIYILLLLFLLIVLFNKLNKNELLEESLFSQFFAVKQNVSWQFQSSVTMGVINNDNSLH